MKTRRLFLKLVVGVTALFPFLKAKPSRKFLTSAHRSEIVGLHLLSPNGDDWTIFQECNGRFMWADEEILNFFNNKFIAENQDGKQVLICFDFDERGYVQFPRAGEMYKI